MYNKELLLNQQELLEKFEYRDGQLFFKKCYQPYKIGELAGYYNLKSYYIISFKGEQFQGHRIIFFMHKGYLPEMIDHEDRKPSNNRIENLRECTGTQNSLNKALHKNADTQYYGITFMNYKKQPKYIVKIRVNGKAKFFGSYISIIDAVLVYNREAVRYHGEFANLNIINKL